ncbi:MAG: hypothetical protein NT003_02080 [Candidatus Magasanikbacteria bacterium]|nr:hypothetical protein [Candidatus Magasanikbacteria bacterium]
MVSRETFPNNRTNLSPDFVAGIISVSGTFIHIHTPRVEQFGFQIKMPRENQELLKLVGKALGIPNKVAVYNESNTHFAVLITRSRKTLVNKIIPFLDSRLLGIKLKHYLQWKDDMIKLSNH